MLEGYNQMTNPIYLTIPITLVTAVVGWIVGHYFTSKRDIQNKRREIIIQHLIDAYHTLACDFANRSANSMPGGWEKKIEDVIAYIQLFGSKQQIELTKKMANDLSINGQCKLDDLINALRRDLRHELKLPAVDGNVQWLRRSTLDTKDSS